MNKINLRIALSSIGIVIILALMGTATYAYFNLEIEGEGSDISLNTFNKNMEVTYTDTSNVTLVNAYTGESISKTFTVENTGNTDVYYNVVFENVVNNFGEPSELVYNITETGNNAYKSETVMPVSNSTILSDIKIKTGETHYYVMQITFLEKDYDQSYNMNKTFSSNINVVPSENSSDLMKQNSGTIGYKMLNLTSSTSNNINYNGTVTDGVYFTNNSINGSKTYYFRGSNSLNNNVLFGGFCFKIVNVDSVGNTKIIYNGVSSNGTCSNNTGSASSIGSATFNDNSNYNAYVGYMYGSPNSASYMDEHKNTNSSKIKTTLESWYATNLLNYANYIYDNTYCNNRKTSEFTINSVKYSVSGYGNLNTGYKSKSNILINNKPSLDCENNNDKFNVQKGLNTYPIGLLTADEAYFAGISETSNLTTNYLYSGNTYWTMSPAYYNGTNAYNYVVQNGKLNAITTSTSANIRPVITLKNNVKVLSGDGSLSSPYKITE